MGMSANRQSKLVEVKLYFGGVESVRKSASNLIDAGLIHEALQHVVGAGHFEMQRGKFAEAMDAVKEGILFVKDKLKNDENASGYIEYAAARSSSLFASYGQTELAMQLKDWTVELLGDMPQKKRELLDLDFNYHIIDGCRNIAYASAQPARDILYALANQLPDYHKVNKWYLNFSKLWYGRAEQGGEYLKIGHTASSQDYAKAMHEAELNCISKNIDTIAFFVESKAEYLDLGSGDAKKTIVVVSALRGMGKDVTLDLIDINEKELEIAKQNADKAGVPSRPIVADFERPDSFLEKLGPGQRVFNLGATYVNYDPDYISQILSSAMQPNDAVYISAQLSRNHNDKKLVDQYSSEDIVNFAFGTLENIGFRPENVEPKTEFNMEKHFHRLEKSVSSQEMRYSPLSLASPPLMSSERKQASISMER
jgi:hypothetical protein